MKEAQLKEQANVTAFVFVEVEPGRDHEFLEQAAALEQVLEAHLVTGGYDGLLVVQGPSPSEIHDWVRHELRRIRDIRSTNTFIATSQDMA